VNGMHELVSAALSAEPATVLFSLGAVLARIGPAIWIAPLLGGRLLPPLIKTGLILVLGLVLLPCVSGAIPPLHPDAPWLIALLLLKEAMLGAALGFIMSLVFWAAEGAGRLADIMRGATLSEVMVPMLGSRSSPLGSFYFMLMLVLFFALGGHRLFIDALGGSYQAWPVSYFPQGAGLQSFSFLAMRLTADLILLAITLAAPIIGALLLSDLTLGLINRFVPQLSVFFLAMPLKALGGIAVLALTLGLLAGVMPQALDLAIQQLHQAMKVLQP
jgi:type III secretion protein T